LRSIKVLKADRVAVEPYVPYSFTQNEEFLSTMRRLEVLHRKNSKRMIRKMAKENGLTYREEDIDFAKKIIHIIVNEMSHEQ